MSHLGKYVPGKAMVVVLRAGMVVPFGGRAATAAIATFYETLVMMAAGGLVAAVGFAPAVGSHSVQFTLPACGPVELPVYRIAALAGLGLGLVFLLLVVPPVFRRLVGLVSVPIPGVGPDASPRITGRLLGQGFFWSSGGWVLLGLSQLAVVRAFDPSGAAALLALGLAPVVIASVALATVAGFVVAVLPGGAGRARRCIDVGAGPGLGFGACGRRGARAPAGLGGRRAGGCDASASLDSRSRSQSGAAALSRSKRAMISVVVPVYNEEESLAALHGELDAQFADAARGPVEFIFVDDGSRDGSWRRSGGAGPARSQGERDPVSPQLRQSGRAHRGVSSSSRRPGLHSRRRPPGRPGRDPTVLARARAGGFDVISGWKKTRHDPWHKVYPSRVFNWMVSRLTGCRLHDHNCGFKLYRREVLKEVGIYGELHRFIPVLAHARGFRVGEVEVHHRRRRHGSSKYGFSRFLKGFLDLLTVRFLTRFSQRPLHVLGGIGLLLFALGSLGMVSLAVLWLDPNYRPIGNRPLLFYSIALLLVGVQLLTLGILAELVTAYNIRARGYLQHRRGDSGQGES